MGERSGWLTETLLGRWRCLHHVTACSEERGRHKMTTLRELFLRGYLLLVIWYIVAALTFLVDIVYEFYVVGQVSNEPQFAFVVFVCVVFGTFSLHFACVVAIGFIFAPKDPSGLPTTLEEPDMCFICSEEYVDPTKLDRCKHVFHAPCLTKWFSVAKMCPMCRSRE